MALFIVLWLLNTSEKVQKAVGGYFRDPTGTAKLAGSNLQGVDEKYAAISRTAAQRKLIDDLLALFGGRSQPVMAHLIESGKLTLDDIKEAEKILRKLARKDKAK
jgi:hypothetical protein